MILEKEFLKNSKAAIFNSNQFDYDLDGDSIILELGVHCESFNPENLYLNQKIQLITDYSNLTGAILKIEESNLPLGTYTYRKKITIQLFTALEFTINKIVFNSNAVNESNSLKRAVMVSERVFGSYYKNETDEIVFKIESNLKHDELKFPIIYKYIIKYFDISDNEWYTIIVPNENLKSNVVEVQFPSVEVLDFKFAAVYKNNGGEDCTFYSDLQHINKNNLIHI